MFLAPLASAQASGFRWQPIEDVVLRGTYSQGFRAPNLGELYGLTQFGPTVTDPCGPTRANPTDPYVVDDADGLNTTPLETACRSQGVGNQFEQANTQITTFTGGNPDLDPEESDSYTFGVVYSPAWAADQSWSQKLDFEVSYYHHEIDDAIQARDIQTLLNACLAAGGQDPTLCSGFSRNITGNLNPASNFLQNFGTIETDGADFKVNWRSPDWNWGTMTTSWQSTYVNDYKAVDKDGIVSPRQVGIEVNDSAIPEWQSNIQVGWHKGNLDATYGLRYIDSVDEYCGNALTTAVPGCDAGQEFHELDATIYNDAQVAWMRAFGVANLKLALGINNIFDEDPPICYSCSLNGYDAVTLANERSASSGNVVYDGIEVNHQFSKSARAEALLRGAVAETGVAVDIFSLLRPGAHIPPHHGLVNTRLICHLPLIVPEKCTFRVGNDVRDWRRGKAWLFDDTIEHEAWNRSAETRVILLFDVWRPELSQEERALVVSLFEAIDAYGGGKKPEWEI